MKVASGQRAISERTTSTDSGALTVHAVKAHTHIMK